MKKKIVTSILGLTALFMIGCSDIKTVELNVLATTDIHGSLPYELSSYVKEEVEKDKNITLVDAGDFFDSSDGSSGDMEKYFRKRRKAFENNSNEYIEAPIAKEMKEVGYDAVVLGNHEFIANNKSSLDNMISDFEKQGIDVLSANTYESDRKSYVKPYTIKQVDTSEGTVNLGILGLTIKEVGEKNDFDENGNLVPAKSRELKDQYGYDGQLYMNDLVEDAKKWVKVMKEDKADIIVAVVHSGEKPKKPKNPGNRIQEIAQEVEGIDAIVAGHTHKQIEQHDYKNKSGEDVIVTQPGKHAECISKINFKLDKNKDGWEVVSKSSKITQFEKSPEVDNFGKLIYDIASIDGKKEEINLSEISSFEWDKAYKFKTSTPRDIIYNTVGYKWRNITETESEDVIQMVFMKDEKVVCYVYAYASEMGVDIDFDESDYKDNVITIYPNDNDRFKVEKGEDAFTTYLTHIKK
ncbi:metallophosphatase [Romboutsia weinsteinii]|uniref:Metallophosphatase n=1 Tax=Romboutsia weinsteinii TaxID=2020949 RepID=A0A371J614_9FIRM|nr:metallophosphoesterase [Romboutsia weinsteinii]RDY28199.1 metallophosphatase [Romboutsia weinsteinii]